MSGSLHETNDQAPYDESTHGIGAGYEEKISLILPTTLKLDQVAGIGTQEICQVILRNCFEMVCENYYRMFSSGLFAGLKEQWGSIVTENRRKIRGKEA